MEPIYAMIAFVADMVAGLLLDMKAAPLLVAFGAVAVYLGVRYVRTQERRP